MEQKEIKCVVWDLDNTIWEGTLLEGDKIKLKLGVVDVIKTLDHRGILHSIASKNNHDDAIGKLCEFGIDNFFLYPEINWNAKSKSIAAIRANLNIGMDTFMFVDDEPYERDEVKSEHPKITCIEASDYLELPHHSRLNPRFVTHDSKRRRLIYLQDQKRRCDEIKFNGPKTVFLKSMNIEVTIHEATEKDLERAEELTVRTNQLNATGQTYSYDELKVYMESDIHKLIVCEMNSKYGYYGIIGLALIEMRETYHHIKLLLMSCRVMSLGIGTILLTHIMQSALRDGKFAKADFKHTGRNRIMYVTFRFAGFKETKNQEYGNIVLENRAIDVNNFPPHIIVKIT